ncbi:hypothetical protein RRG08_028539 [Elysia crispata]|uniref:Uncharacterized protein n=1 Tax=Elysia crispata TaxID=231223 RepID=A0AAE1CVI9_9GAST|nr:hypothetical protein RRG08_028539 [Elysia crispata]
MTSPFLVYKRVSRETISKGNLTTLHVCVCVCLFVYASFSLRVLRKPNGAAAFLNDLLCHCIVGPAALAERRGRDIVLMQTMESYKLVYEVGN